MAPPSCESAPAVPSERPRQRAKREADPSKEVLTLAAVALLFGVSIRTVHRWRRLRARPLPVTRIGRTILCVRSDLFAWLRAHQEKPSLTSPRGTRRKAPAGK